MVDNQRHYVNEAVETFVEIRLIPPSHEFLLVAKEDRLSNASHYVQEE